MRSLLGHSKLGIKGCGHSYYMFLHSYQTVRNKILFISVEYSITSSPSNHSLNVKHELSPLLLLPTLNTFNQNAKAFFQCSQSWLMIAYHKRAKRIALLRYHSDFSTEHPAVLYTYLMGNLVAGLCLNGPRPSSEHTGV